MEMEFEYKREVGDIKVTETFRCKDLSDMMLFFKNFQGYEPEDFPNENSQETV